MVCHGANGGLAPGEHADEDLALLPRLLLEHRSWASDATGGCHVPAGWAALVEAMFSALAGVVGGRRPRGLVFTAFGESLGALAIQVRPSRPRPAPDRQFEAVLQVVRHARLASFATCPCCGAIGTPRRPEVVCSVCDHGADIRAPQASPPPRAFALYRVEDVAAALGDLVGDGVPDSFVPPDEMPDETGHQSHLRRILHAGEAARWRTTASPEVAVMPRLDDLDRRAPHLGEVTSLVRMNLRAALATGGPMSFPPILLVGEPGTGKTWYLSRLAAILGVPFRHHAMNLSSLGEGLSGAHPSWRNARPGLVARTLLSERVANPLILVDEADKPPGAVHEDPYRPLYCLLEPEGAGAFVDEYLQFPIDASAVTWALAANVGEVMPPPILDRLTVIQVPPMDEAQLRAVAASVYESANAARGGFFEPVPGNAVLGRLVLTNVRGIRRAVAGAMVRAAAEGRRSIRPDDVVIPTLPRKHGIGFIGAHQS